MRSAFVILACALLVLALFGCKDRGPEAYHHDGSLDFQLMIPADYTAQAERADGQWSTVVIAPESGAPDLLITWRTDWGFDELLAWFNEVQLGYGDVVVYEQGELSDGAFVHYRRGSVDYVKAIVRCGETALQCMATIPDSVEDSGDRNRAIDACQSVTCP